VINVAGRPLASSKREGYAMNVMFLVSNRHNQVLVWTVGASDMLTCKLSVKGAPSSV
jgi:hypothetical protein